MMFPQTTNAALEAGLDANDASHAGRPLNLVLIDDDELFLEAFKINFTVADLRVVAFTDSEEGVKYLASGGPCDVLVLDWHLRGTSGLDVLRRVRGSGIWVPAIFITGHASESKELEAFEHGAVDFVEKSKPVSIIVQRIIAIRKKESRPHDGMPMIEDIEIGPLTLKPAVSRAFWRRNQVPLTVVEYRIVERFAQNVGQDISYRSIYDVVHGEGFMAGDGENGVRTNVRSLIKRIRSKFRAIDDDFDAIENYPGYGYRWRHPAESASQHSARDKRNGAAGVGLTPDQLEIGH